MEEVIAAVTGEFDVASEQAEANVQELVQELIQQNLIVASDNGDATPVQATPERPSKLPYEIPKLNIYRDMGDLLALDPPVPGLGDTPWKDPEDSSK